VFALIYAICPRITNKFWFDRSLVLWALREYNNSTTLRRERQRHGDQRATVVAKATE
jgi:hypothetical protein